jgi:NAD(P)-dependent dehydrogenase (short-subunit alcohol dehydrogenase family)
MTGPQRTFTLADQHWFRDASGDANPIHVDPAWAAANFPGEIVVHGVHALLWAIEASLVESPGGHIVGVAATFVRPIVLGDQVRVEAADCGAVLRLFVEGELMMLVKLGRGDGDASPAGASGPPPAGAPVERSLAELKGLEGAIPAGADGAALAAAFPAAAKAMGARLLQGIARLSTLVGMECPGLRSMFSELSVAAAADVPDAALSYRVKRVNALFSRVEIAVEGSGLRGEVVAYAGRKWVDTPDADVRGLVGPSAFAGARPLVLGGSSGLGATAARLLAAGGAEPLITWHSAQAAAERVKAGIEAQGGRCRVRHFDVASLAAGDEALAGLEWSGGEVYYFPTPRIFRRSLGHYRPADFSTFSAVYVDRFHDLVEALRRLRGDAPLTIFYPSSVAVSEPGADLVEYAAAKAAGERLCADLERLYPNLRIVVARLPRIDTPQTQSFVAQAAAPPHLAILPWVMQVQGPPTA